MGQKTSARRLDLGRTDGFRNALAAAVVVVLCAVTGLAERLELQLYDAAALISAPAALAEIAIVGIDDVSLGALGPAPWSRDLHARLIDTLSAAGAKTIVYTPSLSDSQSDPGLSQVRKIRAALNSAGDGSPLSAELNRVTAEAETTLDTDARTLLQVKVEHGDDADDLFAKLMGDVVEPRREFIQDNALNVANLDV